MINNDKWINSLPNVNAKAEEESFQIDHNKWENTIPKKNTFNTVKKYSFMTIVFVFGLIFVSVVKNQTRNLEKEISYLKASISSIEFNLDQAILDNEVITSPENLSMLAKEYLNNDLIYYKKSQIKNLDDDNTVLKKMDKKNNIKVINNLPENEKFAVLRTAHLSKGRHFIFRAVFRTAQVLRPAHRSHPSPSLPLATYPPHAAAGE